MPTAAAHTLALGDRGQAAAMAAAAAATAYYTDYVTIPTHPHMANQIAAVPVSGALAQRNDQSPIPVSTSPLHRDHFAARGLGNAGTGHTGHQGTQGAHSAIIVIVRMHSYACPSPNMSVSIDKSKICAFKFWSVV